MFVCWFVARSGHSVLFCLVLLAGLSDKVVAGCSARWVLWIEAEVRCWLIVIGGVLLSGGAACAPPAVVCGRNVAVSIAACRAKLASSNLLAFISTWSGNGCDTKVEPDEFSNQACEFQ